MTPQTKPQTEQRTERARPERTEQIDSFADQVKADAERAADSYARETIVPEGGE